MMTKEDALNRIALAYGCPDVAMTETVQLIQKDALEHAAKIADESEACCGEGERISNLILKFSDSLK